MTLRRTTQPSGASSAPSFLGEAVRHIADQLNVMGLFYNVNTTMVSKRMGRVTPGSQNATQAWNVEEWDVQ